MREHERKAAALRTQIDSLTNRLDAAKADLKSMTLQLHEECAPIKMRLECPICHSLHIDEGEFAERPHHTHACQVCGNVWRPAIRSTVGVRFLPGFKNGE